jgi:hypothetical protein
MDSFHAAIASSYSSKNVSENEHGQQVDAQTEVVVCYTKVEKRACIPPDAGTALVEVFCSLDVAFFEFRRALFEAADSLRFRGVGCGRMSGHRSGPSWGPLLGKREAKRGTAH